MKRCITIIIALTVVFGTSTTLAWWELGHMAINQAAQITSLGELPDAWPSREGTLNNIITKWFCWTHYVKRAPGEPLIPPTPQYADATCEPGVNMYELVKHKLANPGPKALGTALAFMGHNAADHVVHYEYFLGGSLFNWWHQHTWKEEWADYKIYTEKMGGGFTAKYWVVDDEETGAGHWEGGTPTLKITVKCDGDAKVIQLSQRIYTKNRLSTDIGVGGVKAGLDETESMDAILQRMLDHVDTEQKTADTMTVDRFNWLKFWAWWYGWSKNNSQGLWERFDSAVQAVKTTYATHP